MRRPWWRRRPAAGPGDLVLSVAGPAGPLLSLSVADARALMQLAGEDPWTLLETREGVSVTLAHVPGR
jgi:hypothetical protein